MRRRGAAGIFCTPVTTGLSQLHLLFATVKPVERIADAGLHRVGDAVVGNGTDSRDTGQFQDTLAAFAAAAIVATFFAIAVDEAVDDADSSLTNVAARALTAVAAAPVVAALKPVAHLLARLVALSPLLLARAIHCGLETVPGNVIIADCRDALEERIELLLARGKAIVIAGIDAELVTAAAGHASYCLPAGGTAGETLSKDLEACIKEALSDASVVITAFGEALRLGADEQVGIVLLRAGSTKEEATGDTGGIVGRATAGTLRHFAAGLVGDHVALWGANVGSCRVDPRIAVPFLRATLVGAAGSRAVDAGLEGDAQAAGAVVGAFA